MTLFQALVHVSTAYANCDKDEIAEMIYPPPADPKKVMECIDWMDDELLKAITAKYGGIDIYTCLLSTTPVFLFVFDIAGSSGSAQILTPSRKLSPSICCWRNAEAFRLPSFGRPS